MSTYTVVGKWMESSLLPLNYTLVKQYFVENICRWLAREKCYYIDVECYAVAHEHNDFLDGISINFMLLFLYHMRTSKNSYFINETLTNGRLLY